jgi:integrase
VEIAHKREGYEMEDKNYTTNELITYFEEECNSNKQSKKYTFDIKRTLLEFFTVMQISNLNDIVALESDIRGIVDYKNYMLKNGNSDATRNLKLIRICAFFKYLMKKGLVQKNILVDEKVHVRPSNEDSIVRFSMSDISKVIIEAKDEQHFVIRLTLAASGIRYCELRDLKVKDVKDGVLFVHGKGGKDRNVQVFHSLTDILFEFIKHEGLEESDYVFHNTSGGRVSDKNLNKTIITSGKKASVENYNKLGLHQFRHTYSEHMWNAFHVPMTIISKNLGHTRGENGVPTVTLRYAVTSPEHIREYVDKINILDFFAIDGQQINMKTRYKVRYCKDYTEEA